MWYKYTILWKVFLCICWFYLDFFLVFFPVSKLYIIQYTCLIERSIVVCVFVCGYLFSQSFEFIFFYLIRNGNLQSTYFANVCAVLSRAYELCVPFESFYFSSIQARTILGVEFFAMETAVQDALVLVVCKSTTLLTHKKRKWLSLLLLLIFFLPSINKVNNIFDYVFIRQPTLLFKWIVMMAVTYV